MARFQTNLIDGYLSGRVPQNFLSITGSILIR